jgi:hypothetical protein
MYYISNFYRNYNNILITTFIHKLEQITFQEKWKQFAKKINIKVELKGPLRQLYPGRHDHGKLSLMVNIN